MNTGKDQSNDPPLQSISNTLKEDTMRYLAGDSGSASCLVLIIPQSLALSGYYKRQSPRLKSYTVKPAERLVPGQSFKRLADEGEA